MSTKTIKQVLEEGTRFLAAKGNQNARFEAEKLIAFGLSLSRINLYLSFNKPLTEDELQVLRKLFKERVNSKPLQYIIGKVHFRYLNLKVNKHTLIPRPETELIVELALKSLEKCWAGSPNTPKQLRVLELGTGSGAIAISIAKESKAKIEASDVSPDALEVAKENASLNNVSDVNFFVSNWYEKVSGKYDLIISNPPYVSYEEYLGLPAEIKDFEPEMAVTDKADGLKCIAEIISGAGKHLNTGGCLILEIGFDQQPKVQKLMEKAGFTKITFEKDLAGKTRFALASI